MQGKEISGITLQNLTKQETVAPIYLRRVPDKRKLRNDGCHTDRIPGHVLENMSCYINVLFLLCLFYWQNYRSTQSKLAAFVQGGAIYGENGKANSTFTNLRPF